MNISEYEYELDPAKIARYPQAVRSACKMLCLQRQGEQLQDRTFRDLVAYLNPGDLLVVNNSKVIRARLHGKKETGGKAEVLVERIIAATKAWVQIGCSKTPQVGCYILLDTDIRLQVLEHDLNSGMFLVTLHAEHDFDWVVDTYGSLPLPPYLARLPEESDLAQYQTIYATKRGSVAAPTAGLHFDDALFTELRAKGVNIASLTLHVGAGTFQPVRVDDVSKHKMHKEWYDVSPELVEKINTAKINKRRVVAVGTTSVRALESAAVNGELQAGRMDTDLFITPGFKFNVVDALITNFHLPKSTLLMLVAAFAGYDFMRKAYQHAIEHDYKFFSYGDAMLIE